ncbi:nucleotide sugar dehydrogenase [Ruminiclostridium josui]|uniref:nucleotide sugar dehydrogenase n=1 Tax=Ruminiclostridium josui TaxID=1499 RepID=UPI0004677241|nr:nucleotide sugar dehydrogenase [Ruminiclostridium josui]
MSLYENILSRKEKIAVIGLGYVGLPLAIAFSKRASVLGYDINSEKIDLYKNGIDVTKEVGDNVLKNSTVEFTSDEARLKEAGFLIISVPTPVKSDHTPNLNPVELASRIVGRNLHKGAIVVYESTVYPGVTEEICVPILEKESGMKCGEDFKVGYSPERINPGDKQHRLENIIKVVSGIDDDALDTIAKVYAMVIKAGVYPADSIKVAEAAKVIENSQRDINIAFMNEISMVFNKMNINTKSVLEAAGTKWNFLMFTPGLVGGHCIGVDPYYFTYRAEQLGYHSQIILSGRRINDIMGKYIVENLLKNMIAADLSVKNSKVAILGFTFKENCPDTRNTRVIDIVKSLREYGIVPVVSDSEADALEAKREYGIDLIPIEDIKDMDAVVLAVSHNSFLKLSKADFDKMFKTDRKENKVIIDVKSVLNKDEFAKPEYIYWSL